MGGTESKEKIALQCKERERTFQWIWGRMGDHSVGDTSQICLVNTIQIMLLYIHPMLGNLGHSRKVEDT